MKTWLKLCGAAAAALWGELTPVMQVLLILMVLDVASGLVAAFGEKQVSTFVSFKGMAKKSMILIVVAAAKVLEGVGNLGLPLASVVAGFYIIHEALSIFENVGRAGLPLPPQLTQAVEKLKAKPAA